MCPKYDTDETETPIVSRKTHVALNSLHAVVVVWVYMLVRAMRGGCGAVRMV